MIKIIIDTKCTICGKCLEYIPEFIDRDIFKYKLEINIELERISQELKIQLDKTVKECPVKAIGYLGEPDYEIATKDNEHNYYFETRVEPFCPICFKRIENNAVWCKYCRNSFDWIDYDHRHALIKREIKQLPPGKKGNELKSSKEIALEKTIEIKHESDESVRHKTWPENSRSNGNIIQCCICGNASLDRFSKYKVLQRNNELGVEEYVCSDCKPKLPKIFSPEHEAHHTDGVQKGAAGAMISGYGMVWGAILGKIMQPAFDKIDEAMDNLDKIRVIPYYEIKYGKNKQYYEEMSSYSGVAGIDVCAKCHKPFYSESSKTFGPRGLLYHKECL